jgi:hypothetical protein
MGPAPNDEEEQQALKSIPDLSFPAFGTATGLKSGSPDRVLLDIVPLEE